MKYDELKVIERRAYTGLNFVGNLFVTFLISLPLLYIVLFTGYNLFWIFYAFYYLIFLSFFTIWDSREEFKKVLIDVGQK